MTTVVISPSNVAGYPDGGGHFWVYMQYVKGLRALGCEVYWLEYFSDSGDVQLDNNCLRIFLAPRLRFQIALPILRYQLA